MEQELANAEKSQPVRKPEIEGDGAAAESRQAPPLEELQRRVGNRAVQRMLAQRSGSGPFELDDDTAGKINAERSSGQPLDSAIQAKMSSATGHDFSEVKVHTSPESADLSQQIGAVAFTTGNDIFFNKGAYDPQSTHGQELLAHELTHVVQQSSGVVGGPGGAMTVNEPGDSFEQQADRVSKDVTNGAAPENRAPLEEEEQDGTQVQRQELDEDDEQLNGPEGR